MSTDEIPPYVTMPVQLRSEGITPAHLAPPGTNLRSGRMPRTTRPSVAVGPIMPGWGSWDWVGRFLVEHLGRRFRTSTFGPWQPATADVVIVVKHVPPPEWVAGVRRRSPIVYCPIDWYADAAQIEADAEWLRACQKVVVHCRRLVPFFEPFAGTAYLDHPLKFAAPTRKTFCPNGPLLWVGVRSNLAPLVAWANAHPLPAPLDVLTNPVRPGHPLRPEAYGFEPGRDVRVHEWTPERHRQFTTAARAVLDIKGDDFRSRHKPPAKALDFVASGLPLALNPGSSPAEHLAEMGLRVPTPLDTGRWLSEGYWRETRRVGERVSRELAPERVAARFRTVLESVLSARPAAPSAPPSPKTALQQPSPADGPNANPGLPSPPVTHAAEADAGLITPAAGGSPEARHQAACELALRGQSIEARKILESLDTPAVAAPLRALARSDLAALALIGGNPIGARVGFLAALDLDPNCGPARTNLESLDRCPTDPPTPAQHPRRVRVAVVSLLFNWPSTGGGNVHTAELTKFLAEAGYDVRHFYAKRDAWGLGRVLAPTPYPAEGLNFTEAEWTTAGVVEKFRRVIDGYDPDWVILTDSWNMKPLLAAAAGGRRYILRLQALECLCPLNNVRLLPTPGGEPRQCTRHQLATPDACDRCVREVGHTSGDLHRAERDLAGVGTPEYHAALAEAFAGAAAVFAVNPLIAAMVEPHTPQVRVVTAGMDPARFPQPSPDPGGAARGPGRLRVVFAGLTREWMKGFHVLRAACDELYACRQDFEVVVTDTPPDAPEPWARYVGWQSQEGLPAVLAGADVVAVPTVAQEALGRTAVEAMAAGRPVVASRIGGLPFTVAEGSTALLCEPGNAADLAAKLSVLLNDPTLRDRLGAAGRRRFEEHYAWPAVIERHYHPLLGGPVRYGAQQAVPPERESSAPSELLVVVSHDSSLPVEPLVGLLDSLRAFPAGNPFTVRVVVGGNGPTVELPERHRGVEIVRHSGTGDHLGAWDAAWRAGPAYAAYLFVRGECRAVRADWAAAFHRAASQPGVGLVGECFSPTWDAPWDVLAGRFRGHGLGDHAVAGRPAERVASYLEFFRRHGIAPGDRGDHLQGLVLFATRPVLERVRGFPVGRNPGEVIAAEIGFSKKVQAAGLALLQVAPDAFTYVEHPHWLHRRP